MSLGENLYLVMIVVLFASFMGLLVTLSWLDAKDDKIKRRQAHKAAFVTQRSQAAARAASHPKTAFHSG